MQIVEQSVELMGYTQLPPKLIEGPATLADGTQEIRKYHDADPCSDMARITEKAGRVSWKSEDKASIGSADGFMVRVVNIKKDESIAEHCSVTLRMVMDRYASHQLVRHRIAAYTQESTHYINYGKAEKGGQIFVCRPLGITQFKNGSTNEWTPEYSIWYNTCIQCEAAYLELLGMGVKHYNARFVLPGCLKTEVVATYNLRMWRWVFKMRLTPNNTPEIVRAMKLALPILYNLCPPMFEDQWKEFGDGKLV